MGKIRTTKKEMGKIKTTKKEIMKNFDNVISIGYCNLQHLLYYKTPVFYTCGVYGWYSDIYVLNSSLCISTGYSPFGNKKIDYNIQQKYEEKARKIINNNTLSFKTKQNKLDKLLIKLVDDGNNIK